MALPSTALSRAAGTISTFGRDMALQLSLAPASKDIQDFSKHHSVCAEGSAALENDSVLLNTAACLVPDQQQPKDRSLD